jgi:hypothetical protein
MATAGSRVAKAKDRNGKPVYGWMLRQQPWPFVEPLQCYSCTRPVSIVPGYLRRGSPVSAHFRLHEGHDAGCPLNPTRIVTEIALGSQGLAKVRKDGTLRLTIPAQDPPSPPVSLPAGAESEDDERTALRITTVRPWLPPALNSAVKIAQFLRRCDFDPDIAELFTVEYRRKRIPWAKFCYGPDDFSYGLVHHRVAAAKSRRLEHPVAVHGTVLRTGMSRDKPFAVLAAGIPSGSSGRTVEVVLRSSFPTLLEDLQVGMQVLAVGAGWKIFAQGKRNVDEVQLWITKHWYLAYWTWDKDTEQASIPACPPPLPPAQETAKGRRDATGHSARGSSGRGAPRRGAGPMPTPNTTGPRRSIPVLPTDSTVTEPAARPKAERSSDDLARVTLQAYGKLASAPPPATDPATTAPEAPTTSPQPAPSVPGTPPAPTAAPGGAPAAPQLTPPPRPVQPPVVPPQPLRLPGPEQPTPQASASKGIRKLLTRWRRDR